MPHYLTYKQISWLDSHARNSADVRIEPDGRLFVWMGGGAGKDIKVWLPTEEKSSIIKEKLWKQNTL